VKPGEGKGGKGRETGGEGKILKKLRENVAAGKVWEGKKWPKLIRKNRVISRVRGGRIERLRVIRRGDLLSLSV